jgi:Protein of unknown function (DUF3891)
MIIQEQDDQLILIRQSDHAVLSGFFAREWGNAQVTRPEPFASFCLAAGEHDNGWHEWELMPAIDPATFSPYSFMSVPTEEHIALYQRGIERIVKADLYAGLLVCMHCALLYDRTRATMPGYSAKYIRSNEVHATNDFVQRLRLQQLRLKVDLRSNPATKPFTEEKVLNANFERLEALDRLSLYFCMGAREDATIEGVPFDDQGALADWEVSPERPSAAQAQRAAAPGRRTANQTEFLLAPYPFRRDPLNFSVIGRRIPKRRYADDLDFQKTLAQAPYFALSFTLRARDGAALSASGGL